MKLSYTLAALFLLSHLKCPGSWVDRSTEPHILYEDMSWINPRILLLGALAGTVLSMASLVKTLYTVYKGDELSLKQFALSSCCCTFGGLLLGYFGIKQKLKSSRHLRTATGSHNFCPRIQIRNKGFDFATALILHNRNRIKEQPSWQIVTLIGLIQLESIASQEYEERLIHIQKTYPFWLSWLLQPQNFETSAFFIIDNRRYALRRPSKEFWLKEHLRSFLSSHLAKRSLTLQEKIIQITSLLSALKRFQNRSHQNPTNENLGSFHKLPVEIFEHILQYVIVDDKKMLKLPISNEEFFVQILPYITLRHEQNYVVTDSDYKNDVRLPQDVWQLIKKSYILNRFLFKDGEYTIKTHKLYLAKRSLHLTRHKQKEIVSKKKYLKKIAKTLNIPRKNISLKPNECVINLPFKITF